MSKTYTSPAGNDKPRSFTLRAATTEEFRCRPALKGTEAFTAVFTLLTGEGKINWDPQLRDFFAAVMEPDEFSRFDEFRSDPDNLIRADLLMEIAKDLVEEYIGAPFDSVLSVLTLPATNGSTSEAVLSSQDTGSSG